MIYSLRSFLWYVGNRRLVTSWLVMYALMPLLGSMMAIVFYLVLRGGLFSPGTSVEGTSPFGFAALAALVGMFIQQSALKLKDVFEALMANKGEQGKDHVAKTPTQPPVLNPISAKPPHGATATLTLGGENLIEGVVAYADGTTKLSTKRLNDTQIEVEIPANLIQTAGATLQISVRTDSGTSAPQNLTVA
jgi:hypothetical protein